MMHFDKKSYLYRIIKVSAIVVTALLSVALIYAAYSGPTLPTAVLRLWQYSHSHSSLRWR